MKNRLVLLAALAVPVALMSASAFAQHPPYQNESHGEYHGGPPPNHPPPDRSPPHWGKGDRLDAEYRDRQYVIEDWRQYRLSPPPRGYHWVGVGGQYYLVSNSNWAVLRVGP